MTAASQPSVALRCEIVAESRLGAVLGRIVRTCADDLQLTVAIQSRVAKPAMATSITVHLPVDVLIESHLAWRLGFRVACFCPYARVGVLVREAASTGRAAAGQAA
jgi:hypothetical protein